MKRVAFLLVALFSLIACGEEKIVTPPAPPQSAHSVSATDVPITGPDTVICCSGSEWWGVPLPSTRCSRGHGIDGRLKITYTDPPNPPYTDPIVVYGEWLIWGFNIEMHPLDGFGPGNSMEIRAQLRCLDNPSIISEWGPPLSVHIKQNRGTQ